MEMEIDWRRIEHRAAFPCGHSGPDSAAYTINSAAVLRRAHPHSWVSIRSAEVRKGQMAASKRSKVTVVGAGMVGGTVAQMLALRDYADIVLVDIVEGLPQGKALDLMEVGPLMGYDSQLTGSNGYEETAGSDVVVITSGIARK